MDSSQAFESGLTELLPRLRRFAHSLSRNGADADDLTQATVERALRSQATSYACCNRCPRTVTSPFASSLIRAPSRPGFFRSVD